MSKKDIEYFYYILKNKLPLVNDVSLLQLSNYLFNSNDACFLALDFEVFIKEDNHKILYELVFANKTKITFYNDSLKQLNFIIEKNNNEVEYLVCVSTLDNDLDSSYVHAEINYGKLKFIMGIMGNNKNGFIEVIQDGKRRGNEVSYFELENSCDDNFQGINYVTSTILSADLLYTNLSTINEQKLVRNK